MAEPVPTLTLRAEYHPMIIPKLIGFGAFDGDKLIGVITLEEMQRVCPQKSFPQVEDLSGTIHFKDNFGD
jgi:hypothetical protein